MRNRTLVSMLVFAFLVTASAATAGSVSGTITYDGEVPKLRPIDMNADPACAAKHGGPVTPDVLVLGDGNTLGNVFVVVKNAPASSAPVPTEPVVVDQVGCLYEPRVAAVRAGQPVLFKNSDGILHNVHGKPKANKEFNIGMPPMLKERAQVFNTPEPMFPVKCDVHPWMKSYVAVMTHPYFAVTSAAGAFKIQNLPDGTYEIEAWHERLGTQTTSVTVKGGAATTSFSFKKPSE